MALTEYGVGSLTTPSLTVDVLHYYYCPEYSGFDHLAGEPPFNGFLCDES